MKLKKYSEDSRSASKRLKRSVKFEVWINEKKIFTKHNWEAWNDYTALKWIRETVSKKFPNQKFEVYKIIKSQFPPVEVEVIKPKKQKAAIVEMQRPAAEYSNHSPYKIAK